MPRAEGDARSEAELQAAAEREGLQQVSNLLDDVVGQLEEDGLWPQLPDGSDVLGPEQLQVQLHTCQSSALASGISIRSNSTWMRTA